MRLHPVGTDALLVELDDTAAATTLYRAALAGEVEARDIVPAAQTVLFDGLADRDRLAAQLSRWSSDPGWSSLSRPDPAGTRDPGLVEVPTVYDGPDLEDVARLWQMTTAEVVSTHTGTEFTVGFCGFAPGFPYCTGLPAGL